jgi:RNase P subunit RPR2
MAISVPTVSGTPASQRRSVVIAICWGCGDERRYSPV